MHPYLRISAKLSALVAVVGLTAYITHWITLGPEQYCRTTSTSESWSPDRAYKATVLKKDCNLGESTFYSVRVDAFSLPERMAWFTTRELEADVWPEAPLPPDLGWSTPRQLEITMTTTTLGGRVYEHVGDGLTIVRIYNAAKPNTFPNFH
jgi:hypothetical protein